MSSCMNAFGGMQPAELSAGLAQLKGEHPPLLEKIHGLQLLTGQIEKGTETEQTFMELKKNVIVFKGELDPHSEREEGVLFPMLGQYIGTTSGPIAVMEYEHEQAKSFISAFLEKAENTLSTEEMKNAAELVNNACAILTEHFFKEENVLFPMAERMLSEDEKEELHRRILEIK